MNIQFGAGVLFGLPNSGNLAANPTPSKLGLMQEFSVDFKSDLKKLYSQNQFAAATARGKIDVTCKAKIAVFDIASLNQLYFGQSITSGVTKIADAEADMVPATTTYTITVTNAATFVDDLGVTYAATGAPMQRVTTPTTVGQYSVNTATGVYTFGVADASAAVTISYSYTVTTTGSSTLTLSNQLMGYAPQFKAMAYNNFRNEYLGIQLNQCTMGSFNLTSKLEDFWMYDITFDANCDASNTLGKIYAANV